MKKRTFAEVLPEIFASALEAKGHMQIATVGEHRVKAYGVGQNVLRIDVIFAVPKSFVNIESIEIPPWEEK